ncbi:hypothetical protein DFH09DRAFT_1373322 [Mycena vulgaris]|nr:hypothetical protein DFH09DRAFT_1373322 [Mycena vulgaris]
MHLFTSIMGAPALAGTALAQGGATLVFCDSTNCAGDSGGVISGLACNNCYHFTSDWGSANMLGGFPDTWIWYAYTNDNCNPRAADDLGFHTGLGCLHVAPPARMQSVFLKCNGNPGI